MHCPRDLTSLPKRIALLWVSTSLLAGMGCVHMNIPSVRYGEAPTPLAATSHGELAGRNPAGSDSCHGFPGDPEFHGDYRPGSFSADHLEGAEVAPPPEVPWPRFHPLPTRPVYGP